MATIKKKATPPDWDADSPTLHVNLALVDASVRDDASQRVVPTTEDARRWHETMMQGLNPGTPVYVGRFRGEPGLVGVEVQVGTIAGTSSSRVQSELRAFESRLQKAVTALDARYPHVDSLDADGRNAVIELAAWTHSEWVRIHPFANGNGRTSRIWANLMLQRYEMPPVLRLRPRPDASDYGQAGMAGMHRNYKPMAVLIRRLYDATVKAPAKIQPRK